MFLLVLTTHANSDPHVVHRARALSIQMMAIAIALPKLNDLRRSVTSIFLLMDPFLHRFSTSREKIDEDLSIRSLNFSQNTPANSGLFGYSFIYAAVSNAS